METDLTELALNALEAAESADEGNTPPADGGDDKDTGADNTESEDNSNDAADDDAGEDDAGSESDESGDDGKEEEDDAGEDDSDSDSDSDTTDGDESEQKQVKKKEPTDDEFEEMAKKRGYSKTPTEDEKKQQEAQQRAAEQRAAQEQATLERLTRKPREIPEEVWDETPQNNKIVYNNLPVITAKGADGKMVNVKLPDQLPDGFQFADEKARAEFNAAMQEQANRMNGMLNALEQRDRRIEQEQARQQESQRVVSEVTALQKNGVLPTPKVEYGDPKFDKDPAVQTINNVLNLRLQYLQNGVNLSVQDAAKLYRADHPDEFGKKETKAKGDAERKSVAKKIAGSKKSTNRTASDRQAGERKYYKPGMSTQDILDRVLDDLD